MGLNKDIVIEWDGTQVVVCPECDQEVDAIIVPHVSFQPKGARFKRKSPLRIACCSACLKQLGLTEVIEVDPPVVTHEGVLWIGHLLSVGSVAAEALAAIVMGINPAFCRSLEAGEFDASDWHRVRVTVQVRLESRLDEDESRVADEEKIETAK